MDSIVQLAYSAIELFVKSKQEDLPDSLKDTVPAGKSGVFVSIHNTSGELRGCMGTILPTCSTLADEIIMNSKCACSRDRRFKPVVEDELGSLVIKVDVLSEPEPIDSPNQLDPDKYGVIVSTRDGRRGLLLPSLDGVDTVEAQIEICRRKGGIRSDERITLQRFTVERHA